MVKYGVWIEWMGGQERGGGGGGGRACFYV